MAKKKQPVVLNKTELMPTNLGSMKQKESGVITTIIIIALFATGILFLPQIMEMINPMENELIPYVPSQEEKNEQTPQEETKEQITYYALSENLEIDIKGFAFSDFVLTPSTLTFQITNRTGMANFFKSHPYYIEYYTKSEELLGRSKLEEKEITLKEEEQYDISHILADGKVEKIAIREILENEYPAVNLSQNKEGEPILSCSNKEKNVVYQFAKSTSKYELKNIKMTQVITNKIENYQEQLDTYTSLAETLEDIEGIQASLKPTISGFEFALDMDLENLNEKNMNKLPMDNYYYKENTEAKTISFEMQASGYVCK